MKPLTAAFALVLLGGVVAPAQVTTTTRAASIQATGQGTVSITPDQAKLSLGVATQASTAQDASAQNATVVTAVIAALRQVLGANAEIRTISYTLSPNYIYPTGASPTLTGYTASNIVQATITDLSLIGRSIDAAVAAGANQVQGLSFSLQNDQPVRAQALQLASAQARQQAQAIAKGLGVTIGSVLFASDSSVTVPVYAANLTTVAAGTAAPTPVVPGSMQVTATVTAQFAIAQ